jgi:hypothetical protein
MKTVPAYLKPLLKMDSTAREYARERATGTLAKNALHNVRIRAAWRKAEWDEHSEPEIGDVRLRIVADDSADLDDLFGDTFNPKVNSDIPLARLERERQAEVDRVNRDGVWGVIGEYYDGEEWQHADSCFGFIGEDWKDSGYDVDIMSQTLDAASAIETCPTCHRPLRKAN